MVATASTVSHCFDLRLGSGGGSLVLPQELALLPSLVFMELRFEHADFSCAALVALLGRHHEDMYRESPPESVHTLDLSRLAAPDVEMWCMYDERVLLGCGAIVEFGAGRGELKSMRVDDERRGEGLGRALLQFLEARALERNLGALYLETGTQDFFEPARALYRSFGFVPCSPFGSYREDPLSQCMFKRLGA